MQRCNYSVYIRDVAGLTITWGSCDSHMTHREGC